MNAPAAEDTHVIAELRGRVGCITLNRPQALNALSLGMIRDLTRALRAWKDDDAVLAVLRPIVDFARSHAQKMS